MKNLETQGIDGLRRNPATNTSTGPENSRILDRVRFKKDAVARVARAAAIHAPITLMLVSIDNFRECGGVAANICMRGVTDVILSNLDPETDLAGQVRDHEFALMLSEYVPEKVREIAERIRIQFQSMQIRPTVKGGPLTVAVSVVIRVPKPGQSLEALLIAADRNLRTAVRKSGNCVVMPTY